MIYAINYGEDIVAAAAAMVSSGDALMLTGGRVYSVASELRLGNGDGRRHIVHGNGAVIRATSSMRSVVAVYRDNNTVGDIGNQCVIRDLNIECQRLTTHGIYTDTSSRSIYENVDVYQATEDGFRVNHDNDFSTFRNCSARLCGTIWHTSGYAGPSPVNLRTLVTGTCTVGGGVGPYARVVTFSGLSVPLTSMGLRRGDWISVDPSAPGHPGAMFWAPIMSVDSASQLTLDAHPYFVGYGSPAQFSIHKGHGFHFGPGRADNNCHELTTCLAENTGCSGFYLGGLYGPRCRNLQVNAAGAHPVHIGGYASDRNVFGVEILGLYTEGGLNGASNHAYCDGAVGVLITTANTADAEVPSSNPSLNRGVVINNQNLGDATRAIDPIGSYPESGVRPKLSPAEIGAFRKVTVPFARFQRVASVVVSGVTSSSVALVAKKTSAGDPGVACADDGTITVTLRSPSPSDTTLTLMVFG